MENMMYIGANLSKETAENAAEAITKVLQSGFDTHASEEVLIKALDTLKSAVTVQNVSVNNCTFDSSVKKEVNIDVPPDYEVNE